MVRGVRVKTRIAATVEEDTRGGAARGQGTMTEERLAVPKRETDGLLHSSVPRDKTVKNIPKDLLQTPR
jgi:hypothetical protein